jgi:hypothetical protein
VQTVFVLSTTIINNNNNNNKKGVGQPTISSPLPTTAVATKERSFYLMCLPNNVPPMVKGTATNNHNKTKEIAAVVGMEWEP